VFGSYCLIVSIIIRHVMITLQEHIFVWLQPQREDASTFLHNLHDSELWRRSRNKKDCVSAAQTSAWRHKCLQSCKLGRGRRTQTLPRIGWLVSLHVQTQIWSSMYNLKVYVKLLFFNVKKTATWLINWINHRVFDIRTIAEIQCWCFKVICSDWLYFIWNTG